MYYCTLVTSSLLLLPHTPIHIHTHLHSTLSFQKKEYWIFLVLLKSSQYTHTLTHTGEKRFMVRRDGATTRGERIKKMIKLVLSLLDRSENDEIPLSRTMAMLEYEIGLTPAKIMEYLQVGVKTEKFVIDEENDKIISMKKAFSEG